VRGVRWEEQEDPTERSADALARLFLGTVAHGNHAAKVLRDFVGEHSICRSGIMRTPKKEFGAGAVTERYEFPRRTHYAARGG